MKAEFKQIIAKEWLFFIVCLIIGLMLIYFLEGNLIVVMIPYLLFQVIRLTIWAMTVLQINWPGSYPNLVKKIHNWFIPP